MEQCAGTRNLGVKVPCRFIIINSWLALRDNTKFRCQVNGQKTDFVFFVIQRIVGAQVDGSRGRMMPRVRII